MKTKQIYKEEQQFKQRHLVNMIKKTFEKPLLSQSSYNLLQSNILTEGTRVGGGGRLVVAVVVAGGSSSGGVGGGERYPVANQRVFGVRCDQQLENTKWIWQRKVELLLRWRTRND